MMNEESFISDTAILLDSSFAILQYPIKRFKTKLYFLEYADDSLRLYFITVYKKLKIFYIVYDATVFCYAYCSEKLPYNRRIAVWANFKNKKLLFIVKYREIDSKKFCYEYSRDNSF